MTLYLAQTSISFQDILQALAPRQGINLIWDIMLYLIFILAFISMLRGSDKQSAPTIMMAAVAGAAVIAKLGILNPRESGIGSEGVLLLAINASMFFLPLIVVGIADKQSKSRPTAVMGAVIAAVYFFGFWFFAQRV